MSLVQEFDFRAHDSAFKDKFMQLHNVRVRFIPTDKKDIHDMGPMEEVRNCNFSESIFLEDSKWSSPVTMFLTGNLLFGEPCVCCT